MENHEKIHKMITDTNMGGIDKSYFSIISKSIFEIPTESIVNTINCVGVMGAGIALEFKKRFPLMFREYQIQCQKKEIRPGDCYLYYDKSTDLYVLNLAVKNDWKNWSTLEWIKSSIKSMKLCILENNIKSVNLPVIGGMNGKRGPNGKILNMTPPPDKDGVIELLKTELTPFSQKFGVDIRLCIPENKTDHTLEKFLL